MRLGVVVLEAEAMLAMLELDNLVSLHCKQDQEILA
jgi:hypothetical protein